MSSLEDESFPLSSVDRNDCVVNVPGLRGDQGDTTDLSWVSESSKWEDEGFDFVGVDDARGGGGALIARGEGAERSRGGAPFELGGGWAKRLGGKGGGTPVILPLSVIASLLEPCMRPL